MSFFRQHGAAEAEPKKQERKVTEIVMSDGVVCLNDLSLTSVVKTEPLTDVHEKEFEEHITLMGDYKAAQFFAENPDL